MWSLRKRLWNRVTTFKFSHNKPVEIPAPTESGGKVEAVSLSSLMPDIPIRNILMAGRHQEAA